METSTCLTRSSNSVATRRLPNSTFPPTSPRRRIITTHRLLHSYKYKTLRHPPLMLCSPPRPSNPTPLFLVLPLPIHPPNLCVFHPAPTSNPLLLPPPPQSSHFGRRASEAARRRPWALGRFRRRWARQRLSPTWNGSCWLPT